MNNNNITTVNDMDTTAVNDTNRAPNNTIKQADLPGVLPVLTNLRHETQENYEFTTQRYTAKLSVGDGYIYINYITLKDTPAQITAWVEEDLSCINAKVQSLQLVWEGDF